MFGMEPSNGHEDFSLKEAAESCQKSSTEIQAEKTSSKASPEPAKNLVKETTEVPFDASVNNLEALATNTKLNSEELQQDDKESSETKSNFELHQDVKETKLETFEIKRNFKKHRTKKKLNKILHSKLKRISKPILRVVFKRKSSRIPESSTKDHSTKQQPVECEKRKRSKTPELPENLSNSSVQGGTRKKRSRTPETAIVTNLKLSAQNQIQVDAKVPQESLKLKISTSSFNREKITVSENSVTATLPLLNVRSMAAANLGSNDVGNVKRVLFKFRPQEHHIVTKKQGTKMFRCDVCSGIYRQKFSLKRHFLRSHVNIKYLSEADIWNCKIGHQDDASKDHTKSSDSSETKYPLDRKRFKANKNDIFLESNENRVMQGLYKCHECIDVEFDLESEIKAHIASHSDNQKRKFSCNKCDAVFMKKQILSRHLSTHSAKSLFFCAKCNLNFTTKNEYVKHSSEHTSENLCKYCSKSFSTTANKRRHEAIHEGAKQHSCELCSSCFSQGKDLDRHLKKEHSDVCVLCPVCSKVFTSTMALKTHKNKKHPLSNMKKSSPEMENTTVKNKIDNSKKPASSSSSVVQPLKVYTCKYCKKAFSSVYTMIKHRSQKHPFLHGKRKTHKRQVKQNAPQTVYLSKKETRELLKRQEDEFYLTLSQNIADNLLYNLEGQAAQLSLKVYNYNDLKEPSSNHSGSTHHLPWSLYNFPNDFDVDFALRYRGQVIKPKPPETPMSSHDLYLQATGLSRIENSVDSPNSHKANSCYDSSPELSETESFQTSDSVQLNNSHLSLEEKKKLIGRKISTACICNVCKEIFHSHDDFDEHSINNHPNVVCTCIEIEGVKGFPPVVPEDLLRQHLSPCGVYFSYNVPPSITESNNLKCTKCSSQFTAASDLYVHVIKCGGNKYSTPKFVRKITQQRRIKRTMKNRIDLNTKQHPAQQSNTKKTNDRNIFWKSGRLQTTIVKCDKSYFISKPTKALKTFAALSMKPKTPPKKVKYSRADCPHCKRSFRAQDTLTAHINFCLKRSTRNKTLAVAPTVSASGNSLSFKDNVSSVPQNVTFQEPASDVALDLTSKTLNVTNNFVSDMSKKSSAESMNTSKPALIISVSEPSTKLGMVKSLEQQSTVPSALDKTNSTAALLERSNCITPSSEHVGATTSLNKTKPSLDVAQNKTSALDTAIKAINEYSKNVARGKLSPISSLSLSVEKLTKRLNERTALSLDKDKSLPLKKDLTKNVLSSKTSDNIKKSSDLQPAFKSGEKIGSKAIAGKPKIILLCTGKSTVTGIAESVTKIQERSGSLNANVNSVKAVTDSVKRNAISGAVRNLFKNEQNLQSDAKNCSSITKLNHEATQKRSLDAVASTGTSSGLTKVVKVTRDQEKSSSETICKNNKLGAVRALFQNEQQPPSKAINGKMDCFTGAQKSGHSEQLPAKSLDGKNSTSLITSDNDKSLDMNRSANESLPVSKVITPMRSSKSRRSNSQHGRISPSLESIVNSIKQKLHSQELDPPQQCVSWLEDEKFVIPSSAQKQQTISSESIQSQESSTSADSSNKLDSSNPLTPTKEMHSEKTSGVTNTNNISPSSSNDVLIENVPPKSNDLADLSLPESNKKQISEDKTNDAVSSSDPILNQAPVSLGKDLSKKVEVREPERIDSNFKYDKIPVFSVVSDMQDAFHSNEMVSSKLIESIIDRMPKLDTMKSKVSNLLNKADVPEPGIVASLMDVPRTSPLISPCSNKTAISPSKSKTEVEKPDESSQLITQDITLYPTLTENKTSDCLHKDIEMVAHLSVPEKLSDLNSIEGNIDGPVQSKDVKNDFVNLNDTVKVSDSSSTKAKLSHLSVFTNDTIETYSLPPKIGNKSKLKGRKRKTVIKSSQRLSSLRGATKDIPKQSVKNYQNKFGSKKHSIGNSDKQKIDKTVPSRKELHIKKNDLIKSNLGVDKTIASAVVKSNKKQENQDVTGSINSVSGEKNNSSIIPDVSEQKEKTAEQSNQNASLLNLPNNEQNSRSDNSTNTGQKDISNDLAKESQNNVSIEITKKTVKGSSTDNNKVSQDDSENNQMITSSNTTENSCANIVLNAKGESISIDSLNNILTEDHNSIGKAETSTLRSYRNRQIVQDATKTSVKTTKEPQFVSTGPVQFTNILSKMKEKLSLAEKKICGANSSLPNEQSINPVGEQSNLTPTNLNVSSDVSDDAETSVKNESERDEQGRFMCPYCILQFSYLSNFRRHITTCRARRLKKEIDPTPSTSPALLQHLPKKDEVEESMLNLLRHQSRQTQMMKEVEKNAENKVKGFQTYSCNVCHRIYLSLFKLLQHQVTHKLSVTKEEGDEHSFSEDGNENVDSDAISDLQADAISHTASIEAPLEELSDLQVKNENEIPWQTDITLPIEQEKNPLNVKSASGFDEETEIKPRNSVENIIALNENDFSEQATGEISNCDVKHKPDISSDASVKDIPVETDLSPSAIVKEEGNVPANEVVQSPEDMEDNPLELLDAIKKSDTEHPIIEASLENVQNNTSPDKDNTECESNSSTFEIHNVMKDNFQKEEGGNALLPVKRFRSSGFKNRLKIDGTEKLLKGFDENIKRKRSKQNLKKSTKMLKKLKKNFAKRIITRKQMVTSDSKKSNLIASFQDNTDQPTMKVPRKRGRKPKRRFGRKVHVNIEQKPPDEESKVIQSVQEVANYENIEVSRISSAMSIDNKCSDPNLTNIEVDVCLKTSLILETIEAVVSSDNIVETNPKKDNSTDSLNEITATEGLSDHKPQIDSPSLGENVPISDNSPTAVNDNDLNLENMKSKVSSIEGTNLSDTVPLSCSVPTSSAESVDTSLENIKVSIQKNILKLMSIPKQDSTPSTSTSVGSEEKIAPGLNSLEESLPEVTDTSPMVIQDKVPDLCVVEDVSLIVCHICKKEFNSIANRNRHLIMKHKRRSIPNKDSDKKSLEVTPSLADLPVMKAVQIGVGPSTANKIRKRVSCPMCGKKFNSAINKRRHMIMIHGMKDSDISDQIPDNKPMTSESAPENVTSSGTISKDINECNIVCPICGKEFNSAVNRNRHIIMKHKTKWMDVKDGQIQEISAIKKIPGKIVKRRKRRRGFIRVCKKPVNAALKKKKLQ